MPIKILGDLSLHLKLLILLVYLSSAYFSAYFPALSADKAAMETPVHIFTQLFKNSEAGVKIMEP